MQKIGIKFEKLLDYERFEPLQYWLDYDFEYENLEEFFETKKVIELEFEEDEDRAEDIEMLQSFLEKFDNDEIVYELFVMNDEWEKEELKNIV
jgi:disulfide oxidoreductase YuzD